MVFILCESLGKAEYRNLGFMIKFKQILLRKLYHL